MNRPYGITALGAFYVTAAVATTVSLAGEETQGWADLVVLICRTFLLAVGVATGIGLCALRDWARRFAVVISATYLLVALGTALAAPLLVDGVASLYFSGMALGLALLHRLLLAYLRQSSVTAAFAAR